MPNFKDLLPPLPWNGPPIPKVLTPSSPIDIYKLPGWANLVGKFFGKTYPIMWVKHRDGTVSFTSVRLNEADLKELLEER